MFDVGFSELLLIGFVALIVLGPERLPKAARFAGLWVRKARAQWYAVRAELESELAAEELRNEIRGPLDTAREVENLIRDVAAEAEPAADVVPHDDDPAKPAA
jgi:sec-independent protein translocase protein TatB